MSDRALGQDDVRYARALLQEERDQLLPSRGQLVGYRLFNVVAIAMLSALGLVALGLIGAEIFEWQPSLYLVGVAASVAGALSMVLVPAFLLNLPLVRKFWRLAGFRRDLGLTAALTPAFLREREKHPVRNKITGFAVLAASVAVIASIVEFIYEHWQIEHSTFQWEDILFPAFVVLVGLSIVALHYMRRAKERLAIVTRLLDSLAKETSTDEGGEGGISMSLGAYKAIANLERENILLERQRSIRAASKTNVSGFALQRSREVQEALGKLPHDARHAVEKKIFSLLDDASPSESSLDSETGLRTLPIDDSGRTLLYDVDKKLKRVRIHRMNQAEGGTPES